MSNNRKITKIMLMVIAVLMFAITLPLANPTLAQTPTPAPEMPEDEVVRDEAYQSSSDLSEKPGGIIDIFDLSFVASRFNSTNPAADINLDGKVDIFDLSMLANKFGKTEAEIAAEGDTDSAAAPVPTSTPIPMVEEGQEGDDFGDVLMTLEVDEPEASAQGTYVWRPLKIGLGINRVYTWDYMDGQSKTPPDFYAMASVGGSFARTNTVHNNANIYPYWRLGWWQYKGFPKFDPRDPAGEDYYIPVTLQVRDDDGQVCYGYYGCRHNYEVADATLVRYERVKTVRFYPSSCQVLDDKGVWTDGYFVDGYTNRCRVDLYTWGDEWPRAGVNFYLDAWWE